MLLSASTTEYVDCAEDGSGVGDSAVPEGGGVSVLAGWLGRPWASGISAQSYLRVAGAGPSSSLASGRAFLGRPRPRLSLRRRRRHVKSCRVCSVLPPRQVIGAGIFFFPPISAD